MILILLGITQFIIIFINCIYELKKKSAAVFLWAVLLVMFGIPHLFTTFLGSYTYSESTINDASIFVIFFSIIYLFVRVILTTNHRIYKSNKEYLKDKSDKFLYLLFIIFIIVVLIRLVVLIKSAGGIFNTSWSTMRESGSESSVFSRIFIPFFFMSSSCILLALRKKNKKIFMISGLLVIIEVIISRNRIDILPLFVAIIYNYLIGIKQISLKKIFTLGLIGIIAIYMIYALRVFRHAGSISNFFEQYNFKTFNEKIVLYFKNDDGELGLREYMYYFIENDNNFDDFGKGNTYIRMLLVFVPTDMSLGIKPSDFAISMGKAVKPGSVGYSMHPTLFGDVYANFGFYGFLWGAFWAIFTSVMDKIINKKEEIISNATAFIVAIAYIIQARGSVYNAFIWAVYGYIFLIIIYKIFIIISNKKGEKTDG